MEDFLDFIGSLYDDTVDALSSFWDSFTEWVSDVWNWLKNFFYKAYECIESWFEALGDWAEKELKKLSSIGTVVISDSNSPIGEQISDIVSKIPPMSLKDFKAKGASQKVAQYQDAEINGLTMDGNQIVGISAFDAKTVLNPNGFRQVIEERGGAVALKLD